MDRTKLQWLLRAFMRFMSVLYGLFGLLTFLLFPAQSTLVQYGGPFANAAFWGWAFIISASILREADVRWGNSWHLRFALLQAFGLSVAWWAVRLIIIIETHRDIGAVVFTSLLAGVWIFALIIAGEVQPDSVGVPYWLAWTERLLVNVRARLVRRKP